MKAPQKKSKGRPDFLLLIMTLILVGFGLVMVFSASSGIAVVSPVYDNDALYFTKRQLVFAALGIVGMFFLMNIPFRKLGKLQILLFIPVIIMLAIVPFIGTELNGARSWFGFAGLGIQPTEFAKLSLILYLGALIAKKGEKFRSFKRGLVPVLIIVAFVCALIMMQPDLGACIIIVSCAAMMIWAGGANLKQLFFTSVIGVAVLTPMVAISYLIDPASWRYRIARFTSFKDPLAYAQGDAWQLVSSLQALGHGGIAGAGFGESVQKLHYLQYAYNDFIFAIIAEELGFIGAALFILFYLVFIWRGLLVAVRCPDTFGMVTGVGIVGLLAFQAFINIGGVTGAIPLTGVTLPFISYGGSSLLVTLMCMGVLLSISREYYKVLHKTTITSTTTKKTTAPSFD
ncbi:putative lipid II flippase FtsW [Paenibacillus endoradicis]|uniref:putative lipid II flippase FtsW n=1 Tax=Paenibacillus endoradicis TaxID=2972487 RepID=UPI002158EE94|nr:putative lipid II flippase FtsW [Paenibacillus endoradicis]MCR8656094.1 putative lipid II flippase FtsW [Paenibacillus endoradicis]MCR8658420.1 putative lipid II flippase FtsW [Paenibacillus endoradicis]